MDPFYKIGKYQIGLLWQACAWTRLPNKVKKVILPTFITMMTFKVALFYFVNKLKFCLYSVLVTKTQYVSFEGSTNMIHFL